MSFGWMGKILDVDLTSGTVSTRETMPYAREYLGGRAMAARIAWEEIPAGTDPYDAENRIIIATGPLTGTLSPTSGRTIMGSLSPRIYPRPWYTHSTLGGWFGAELKYAGFDAVVIWGKTEKPVYLEIEGEKARLQDAAGLWGMGAREVQLGLKKQLGEKARSWLSAQREKTWCALPPCNMPRRTPPATAALARSGAARSSRRLSCEVRAESPSLTRMPC